MDILIACEESQVVCKAFRELGHNAFSCDVEFCSGGLPEYHIWADVVPLLNGGTFRTCDGQSHYVKRWDMIIAFPPCTYLSKAGGVNLYKNGEIDETRLEKGFQAKEFFLKIWNADCDKIVIENPIPLSRFNLPNHSQVIQPYYFGEPVSKKTYLWLKGVSLLCPTNVIKPIYTFNNYPLFKNSFGKYRQKNRSKTLKGVALAMALSWGNL